MPIFCPRKHVNLHISNLSKDNVDVLKKNRFDIFKNTTITPKNFTILAHWSMLESQRTRKNRK